MSDKPLYVQVAEALGWTDVAPWAGEYRPADGWDGVNPGAPFPGWYAGSRHVIPRYDIDWSTTGPLIEEFVGEAYDVSPGHAYRDYDVQPRDPNSYWVVKDAHDEFEEEGRTLLIAVCNLILKLHKAGKLRREETASSLGSGGVE